MGNEGIEVTNIDIEEESPRIQGHTHEYVGSVLIVHDKEIKNHNHRFTGVTGEAIYMQDGTHIHYINSRTDYFDDHYHDVCAMSEKCVYLETGKHVHYMHGTTDEQKGHKHKFQAATLIENPLE